MGLWFFFHIRLYFSIYLYWLKHVLFWLIPGLSNPPLAPHNNQYNREDNCIEQADESAALPIFVFMVAQVSYYLCLFFPWNHFHEIFSWSCQKNVYSLLFEIKSTLSRYSLIILHDLPLVICYYLFIILRKSMLLCNDGDIWRNNRGNNLEKKSNQSFKKIWWADK